MGITKTFLPIEQLNEADRKTLKDAIGELDNSLVRMDGERALQKSVLDDIEEKLNVDKKLVRKLAKIYHKQNIDEVSVEFDAIETSYDTLLRNKTA